MKKKFICDVAKGETNMNEILSSFDFSSMQKCMHLTNHKWAVPGGVRVPTIDELRQEAIRLLSGVISNPDTIIECGGFRAYMEGNILSLEYIALWAGADVA